MSYNGTYSGPEIDMNSFLSFKQHNDLFVKNYADLTFHDIYNYYLVVLWVLVTSGLSAYAVKQFYLLCVMMWNYRGDEVYARFGNVLKVTKLGRAARLYGTDVALVAYLSLSISFDKYGNLA